MGYQTMNYTGIDTTYYNVRVYIHVQVVTHLYILLDKMHMNLIHLYIKVLSKIVHISHTVL